MATLSCQDELQRELGRIREIIQGRVPPPNPIVGVSARSLHGAIETCQVVITISGDTIEQVVADALRGVEGDPVDYGE